MALRKNITANNNPTDTKDIDLYVKGGGLRLDTLQGIAIASFHGWASAEAAAAGKQPVYNFPGVRLGPQPQPAKFDPATGTQLSEAIPSMPAVVAAFSEEFNAVAAILYVLAKRYDPQLRDAADVQPGLPVDVVAAIEAKLDLIDSEFQQGN